MPSILHVQALWHSFSDHFPSVAEQFEEDDDPKAFLDESSSASREYEEAEISTSASLTDHSFIPSNANLSTRF